jgi:hypothetical protein
MVLAVGALRRRGRAAASLSSAPLIAIPGPAKAASLQAERTIAWNKIISEARRDAPECPLDSLRNFDSIQVGPAEMIDVALPLPANETGRGISMDEPGTGDLIRELHRLLSCAERMVRYDQKVAAELLRQLDESGPFFVHPYELESDLALMTGNVARQLTVTRTALVFAEAHPIRRELKANVTIQAHRLAEMIGAILPRLP